MNHFLKNNAPALLLILASAILAAAFSLPIGAERQARTPYAHLGDFAGPFEAPKAPDAGAKDATAAGTETWGLVAQAVRQSLTPVEADALLRRVESLTKAPETAQKAAAHADRLKTRELASAAAAVTVAASSAAVKPEAHTSVSDAIPAPETADSVGEAYENDPAKYSLDANAALGSIILRLRGLSRSGGRYILKVSVTNRGGEDFFVREFALRDGPEVIGSKSFVRLFVEPGRTREGFVVFEKPRTGAAVHVALKEDREKGRIVELLVPYPF